MPTSADNEVPAGLINSTTGSDGNGVFTLAYVPSDTSRVKLYLRGVRLTQGIQYAINLLAGVATITFVAGYYPLTGDSLLADYAIAPASTSIVVPGTVSPAGSTVRNLLLDPVTHDIVIAHGQLQLVSDRASVAQAVGCALRTFLGEWFLDSVPPSIGVPYFQRVLVKNPNADALRSVFISVIEAVTGIDKVQSLQLNYDRLRRALAVAWSATTNLGALVSGNTGL